MTACRIFYAWQSDRPANLCRSLIRNALDDTAIQFQNGLEIDDAPRVEIEIDQDTQGEAGSPPVAETIFRKIRECDAFVADLTFTGYREGMPGSPVPNSNVLIEYGYALGSLGHERVFAVFNEQFGNCDDLPFDLRHRRWPIRYRTLGIGSDEQARRARRTARDQLASEMAKAIRYVVRNAKSKLGDSTTVNSRPLAKELPLAGGLVRDSSGQQYRLPDDAKILLSLRSARRALSLKNVEVQKIAQESLKPLASARSGGWSQMRVANGTAVAVLQRNDVGRVLTASILLRDGSIFGIDGYHIGQHERANFDSPFVPTGAVEEILVDGLGDFLGIAQQQLNLELPLEVGVALEGVKNHYIAVDRSVFSDAFHGPILVDRIEDRFEIDSYGVNPAEALKPFFEMIFDEARLIRP